MKSCLFAIAVLAMWGGPVNSLTAQKANYDEDQVPQYVLPDPLIMQGGDSVSSAGQWNELRRAEILKLLEDEMYGRAPKPVRPITFTQKTIDALAIGGLASFVDVTIHLLGKVDGPTMNMLLVIPNGAAKPVPAFVGMNFMGNASTSTHPKIPLSDQWMRRNPAYGTPDNRMTEATRGTKASRWPYHEILARGYAVGTIYYGDVDPDFDDGFQNGIHPAFYRTGQKRPAANEWGSIAAWAWGLSRAMDYFERQTVIDARHVAVIGHSRLGKTSLWAGATDQRFSLVISNNSGCGGAALSRRKFGETVQRINTSFPHWFCDNFKKYNDREKTMPLDQHMLIALMAPRPVLVCSAQEDRWADPRGEFLACLHASPVFKLLGASGLSAKKMPAVHQPSLTTVGYHLRAGKHDVTSLDWQTYCDFADRHWGRKKK